MKDSRRPRRRVRHRSGSLATGAVALGAAALAVTPAAQAATFNVTNLNDSGAGSLRQALADANALAGADTVTFQSSLSGTIALTSGDIDVTDSVDIQGPGSSVLSVSGSNSSRVFYLYNGSTTIDVTISGLTVTDGKESIGGGIVDFDENLTLDDVVIKNSQASGDGGGLWADGFNMNLTIRNSTISGNTAANDGGGIYIEDTGGPLVIQDSVISGNAAVQGAGIYLYDPDTDILIERTTISNNAATAEGGGIYLYSMDAGTITITESTFSGNSATYGGGIFFYDSDHPVLIENTTFSGNQATIGGGGIALYNVYAPFTMNLVTIANNTTASGGGGIAVGSGPVTITNSIVADNSAPANPDLGNNLDGNYNVAYSLVETPGTSNFNDNGGNITGQDPALGPLQNNGGPTQTHMPQATSPAIDAGDPAFVPPPATDQRGLARVVGAAVDMGAVEVNPGQLVLSTNTASVAENGGSIAITVNRVGGTDNTASAGYATADGSATAGADYSATSGTVTFASGDSAPKTFNVPIVDDMLLEGSETFSVALANPVGATLGTPATETVTITDWEPGTIQFSSATYSVTENGGALTVTVQRVNGTSGTATVNYATSNGTATAGADYTATSGTLSWADGDSAPKTFTIPILDDTLPEGDETINLLLSAPTGAVLGGPSSSVATIVDYESGVVQFTASSADTTETSGTVTMTLTRTGGTSGALSVDYATSNGSATAGSDYTATSGTITFADGQTSATITIPVLDDAVNEPAETFNVALSNASGGTIGAPASVTITIAASDVAAVPLLDGFGKIVLALLSALVGVVAIGRGRVWGLLFAILFLAATAAPMSAQMKPAHVRGHAAAKHQNKHENKTGKTRGVLASVTKGEHDVTLKLQGGETMTIADNKLLVIRRGARHGKLDASALAAGQQVVIRTRGNHVRVRIIS